MAWRTAFVGREHEIELIRALLARTRLLTLTGPGGIGKTRLAVEATKREASAYAGGVLVVELAALWDPSQVLGTVGATLGLRDSGAADIVAALSERLGLRPTLLLLDNMEQLLDAASEIGRLMDATPSLRLVVTSRVPLGLSGEQEYAVPPMELPTVEAAGLHGATPEARALEPQALDELASVEAVALLVDRARRVVPGFELSSANARAIVAICRSLDGLPLAIELAASRLKLLTPEALLARLGQRLEILTGGASDAPARQRTLRATIGWSFDLLSPDQRNLFRRCGIFVGGFTAEEAAAIEPPASRPRSEPLLAELGRLVDHSLLTVAPGGDDEPRFGMLETIREYALDGIASDDLAVLRSRQLGYAVEFAEHAAARLRTSEQRLWLNRIKDDLENLRAALGWAAERGAGEELGRLVAALAPYWRYYGDLREGLRWTAAALALSEQVSEKTRAKVLRASGWLEAIGGNLDGAVTLLESALQRFELLGDEPEVGATLYHLGATRHDQDRDDEAQIHLDRALAIARAHDDPALAARTLVTLANLVGNNGDARARTALSTEAIAASRRAGDLQRVGLALNELAWAAWVMDRRDEAIEHWLEAVELLRKLGERAFLGSILLLLGYAQARRGEFRASRDSVLEGVLITREAGALPDLLAAISHGADWFRAAGAPALGATHWERVAAIGGRHGIGGDQLGPFPWGDESLQSVRAAGAAGGETGPTVSIDDAIEALIRDLQAAALPADRPASPRRGRGISDLTPREQEVLELVALGRSNAEIGRALFISRKTASVHVANIKDKLGADSRIGIVTLALQQGLVRAS